MAALERGNALEGATSDRLRRDLRAEAFDLVLPARAGRREMQLIPRMADKPADDFRRLGRAVVVYDHVDVSVGQLRVDVVEKCEKSPDAAPGDDIGRSLSQSPHPMRQNREVVSYRI